MNKKFFIKYFSLSTFCQKVLNKGWGAGAMSKKHQNHPLYFERYISTLYHNSENKRPETLSFNISENTERRIETFQ